jgi:hypothetical protein
VKITKKYLQKIINEEIAGVLKEQLSGIEALKAQGVAVTSSYHKDPKKAEKEQASYREAPPEEYTKSVEKAKSTPIKKIFNQVGRDVLNKEFQVDLNGKAHKVKLFNHQGGAAFSISGNSYKISSGGFEPKIKSIKTDGNVLKITGSWGPISRSVVLGSPKLSRFMNVAAGLVPGKSGSITVGKNKVEITPI